MARKKRTFLLGAGFSKAIADGPTMKELWSYIENAFEYERKNRCKISDQDNPRIKWFEDLDNFIKKLEKQSTTRFEHFKDYQMKVDIRENLEYLITFIDLHLSGPKVHFEKEGSYIDPYPAIPAFICKKELEGARNVLQTYLYLALVNLKAKTSGNQFANIISKNDSLITFNYDLILEQLLWNSGIWSPLEGYVGVSEFEKIEDKNKLAQAERFSQLKIHKMHGSINWQPPSLLEGLLKLNKEIVVGMDNLERNKFYFDGIDIILERPPENVEYGGRHEPGWVLPSFIKPFEWMQFFEIWKSAIRVLSESEELIIVGYSFRPEDSNAFLLLSMLPITSKIILVDTKYKEIEERLGSKGIEIHKTFESLEKYLDNH